MKKKIIIILSIITFLIIVAFFLYRQFGPDISILLAYEVTMPVPDKTIYSYEEFGRDGGYYRVVRYSDRKLKRIKWEKIEDLGLLNGIDSFFDKNKLPEKYKPTIDKDTYYYEKTFEDSPKKDYLLMIYNPDNKLVYIYEFHI